ncbi:MAG TPA: Ig-like domain-containing protein, partial [Terriglobales bacterium]|nr:Ig-like domain-containing protein [Terriglobales bacterium]
HPQIFQQQTQWIVANQATWNIQAVIGEGDIVNTPTQSYEWANADTAIKTLDQSGIPYTLAIGNHDYDGVLPQNRSTTAYNQWFGVSRYIAKPWYLGHYGSTNENFYTTFTVNGQQYIVMALEYFPRDPQLQWAASIIEANPNAKIFVTTHSFLYTDGTRGDTCDTNDMRGTSGRNPETVWENVLKKYGNVQLVVSGHLIGNNTAHRTDLGVDGNVVNEIFTNFQNLTNGGNGWLRILKFRPTLNRVEAYTYSPSLNQWRTDAADQFTLPITNTGNAAVTGALEGKIRTLGCSSIVGATVTAGGASATTDANGHFVIPNLDPDEEEAVSASANGYLPDSAVSSVYAGFSNQTDFYLLTPNVASCTLGTTDPSVTICSPGANATVTSPVHVNGGTTTSVGMDFMQVYIDGIAQNTTYASSLDLNLPVANGTHQLTMLARLNDGTTVKKILNFVVGTAPNGITMISPVNGATVSNPVAVSATANSSAGISFVQLYVDTVKKLQVSGNTLNTTLTLAAGSHRITTQARDTNGVYYKQTATITVSGSTGGTSGVTMTSPVNGSTVSNPVVVQATASSNVAISFIELWIDGVKKTQVSENTLNYSVTLPGGSHRITAQAKDANGMYYKQTANVTVQ